MRQPLKLKKKILLGKQLTWVMLEIGQCVSLPSSVLILTISTQFWLYHVVISKQSWSSDFVWGEKLSLNSFVSLVHSSTIYDANTILQGLLCLQ